MDRTDRTEDDCESAFSTCISGSDGDEGVIGGMGGKGFIRAAIVRACSKVISEDGCLLNDGDSVGETGVRRDRRDGDAEDSVTSVTVCNFKDDLLPATVVAARVSKTFCVRLGLETCMVPDKEADLEG